MEKKFLEIKKEFSKVGYVLTKNDFSGGYSAAKDIGDGYTDENSIIIPFKDLAEAEKWLEDKIERDKELEKFYKEANEGYYD